MTSRGLLASCLCVLLAPVACATAGVVASEQVVLEQSKATPDYAVLAKAVLEQATRNADLRQALAHPSRSVQLYVLLCRAVMYEVIVLFEWVRTGSESWRRPSTRGEGEASPHVAHVACVCPTRRACRLASPRFS